MGVTDYKSLLDNTLNELEKKRTDYEFKLAPKEVGRVTSVSAGVVKVSGLPSVGYEELLKFPGDLYGIAFSIEEKEIGAILLGEDSDLNAGDLVERTNRVMDVPVGKALIGRVIGPLGEPMDEKGAISYDKRLPIERNATPIMDRSGVSMPLQTGIKVIDALIPIGRGQRELILGDRQTGKTAIAIDTIVNQKDKDVICVYCAIGQRASAVAKVVADLKDNGAMAYTVVMVTEGNNSPGLQYIAPYAATSIAEYFMEMGKDVLIVYDDLTNHARAYRELSLLLKRPPGREAFPGDIFYIHSRLLERSTHLSDKLGGGSLTALPIIETEAQNMSAYIPTNLISITDGQIYLSPKQFELGILPAVEVGKSVSRVGGKAQLPAYQSIAGALKLGFSQFEELETFARFGSHLDEETKMVIEHGKRIREILKQNELQPLSVAEQIGVLLALTKGYFDAISIENMSKAEKAVIKSIGTLPDDVYSSMYTNKGLDDAGLESILKTTEAVLKPFQEAI
ncbi:alternate F1F0 ATPase, F1 subunit alpha [Maribacter stanieri]|uniref:alternate F1F0 ATPase, F1 subunit alpha n=1 Tax=Maribacter stanieri TaxID=440514 RepID=UPI002494884C|nr:alternate F1F0 ATPase, F1 subunit alpha [Maribacter stanieri]